MLRRRRGRVLLLLGGGEATLSMALGPGWNGFATLGIRLAAEQGPPDQLAAGLVQRGFEGGSYAADLGAGSRFGNDEGACGNHALVQAVDELCESSMVAAGTSPPR